jgi:hypothetical protein
VVIDAMDEYQNIDQHQVDKVFEQVADVIRKASVSIGCKISGRTAAHGDTRVCCDPPETQEAEVAMHSNWHQTGNSCDARRRTKR